MTSKKFTDEENRVLCDFGIAVFRNKVIIDAQPPVSDSELAQLKAKVDGELPEDLLALWKTAFGGELDYDYEILFGDHVYAASLRQLFYPDSGHYLDLYGWIDHELEFAQAIAEEDGHPTPQQIGYVPFAGFEYLERFYVSLEPKRFGVIDVYVKGIPWKGRLNEDSHVIVASSLGELFDELSLNEDPFDEQADEHGSGKDLVGRILDIQQANPSLAEKLKSVVQSNVINWQQSVDAADFSKPISAKESKALRLALRAAVKRDSTELIDHLHSRGVPFDISLHGTNGVLHYAMTCKAFGVVKRLLDLQVALKDEPIDCVSDCSNDLILRLIDKGLPFEEEAIYTAAETGSTESAVSLILCGQVEDSKPINEIQAAVLERADEHEESADDVEAGRLGSALTADQYRQQAQNLRAFANMLSSEK